MTTETTVQARTYMLAYQESFTASPDASPSDLQQSNLFPAFLVREWAQASERICFYD